MNHELKETILTDRRYIKVVDGQFSALFKVTEDGLAISPLDLANLPHSEVEQMEDYLQAEGYTVI